MKPTPKIIVLLRDEKLNAHEDATLLLSTKI
jgi:hypothetical protein